MDTVFALFFGVVLLAVVLVIYFVPLLVAKDRHHPQIVAIGVINVFAGWTLIGWVGALAWALIEYQPREITSPPPAPLFPRTTRALRHP